MFLKPILETKLVFIAISVAIYDLNPSKFTILKKKINYYGK